MIAYSTAAVAIAKSAPHGRRRSSLSLYFDDIDAPLCRTNYDSSHIGQSVFCHPAAALEQAWSPPKVPRAVGIYTCKIAEAEAQGLPYVLAPRVLSRQEWIEQYSVAPASPPCSSGSRATVCRICNGLGIMRACLETQKLEQLEARTFTHRYVVEAPAQLSRDEWEKKYSLPAPAETKCDRTPSDESLVLSNE